MDHIDAMDELKRGIYLRSMGQKDPVVEYRFEGFAMFDEMIAAIREDTARAILTFRIAPNRQPPKRVQVMRPDMPQGTYRRTTPKKPPKKMPAAPAADNKQE
jgi:preprotein translocase subunit SecA